MLTSVAKQAAEIQFAERTFSPLFTMTNGRMPPSPYSQVTNLLAEKNVVNVLTVDIGGTSVKFLVTGESERRKFASGPKLTPSQMVSAVKERVTDWKFDAVSIGYPGIIKQGRIFTEPHNLAPGWINYDFQTAFDCPVKLINDAAMQAMGSYRGGTLLFLGFGTGLGSALIVDGTVVPMELGHLSYKKTTFEDYVGLRGLLRLGKKRWKRHVVYGVERLIAALHPDDIVLGGGNAKKLHDLPPGCRRGDNSHALVGGFRLWESTHDSSAR